MFGFAGKAVRRVAVSAVLLGTWAYAASLQQMAHFPLNDLEGIITRSGVELDSSTSSDGHGSLRITATEPATVRLYEVENINVERARLVYQAQVRTQDLDGKAYLEMWCHFPGKGEFFSRALSQTYSGTTGWSQTETPFFLKKGQNPDRIRLNLVIEGKGTAWIDDIRLLKAPLR